MTTQVTVSNVWPEAASMTASGDQDLSIQAPGTHDLYWTIGATKPSYATVIANRIPKGQSHAMVLSDTVKLWLVCPLLKGSDTKTVLVTHE